MVWTIEEWHIQAHYPHEEDQRQDQELARVQPCQPLEDTLFILLGWPVRQTLVEPHHKPQQSRRHACRGAQSIQADGHVFTP